MPDYLFKDHKPSAVQGEARLRGLYRIISAKTIISVIAWSALPAECRPKFISVIASGAPFPGAFNLVHQVQPL
jgi:hypothetical protein